MKTFKNILVGIDYSEASKSALKQAGRIAQQEGASLVAIHVLENSEIEEYEKYYAVPTDAVIKAAHRCLHQIVEEELGSRDAAMCQVVIGIPSQELIRRTEETPCDLLVLGSRGSSGHPHEVGFFAAKCVRHTRVPVLLNRVGHGEPFKRIVACVDFSEATQDVIESAAKIALDEKAELHLVHAFCPPWMRPTHVLYNLETAEDDDYKAQYRELLEEQMEAAARSAGEILPGEIHRHTLEHPNPQQAILNLLKDHHADLAVVARSGKTGAKIKQFLLGSTAERLIHHSPCSVITVPCGSQEKD